MDPVRFSPQIGGALGGLGEVKSLSDYEGTSISTVSPETPSVSFADVLGGLVDQASSLHHVADAKAQGLAAGTHDDLHGTMITLKEAEISMKLVGSIRNKVLEAFHELWRTSV